MATILTQDHAGVISLYLTLDGVAVEDLVYTDIVVDLKKSGEVFEAKILTVDNFIEQGAGTYKLYLSEADNDTVGNTYVRAYTTDVIDEILVDYYIQVAPEEEVPPVEPVDAPTLVAVYGYLKDSDGSELVGASVNATMLNTPFIYQIDEDSSVLVSQEPVSTVTDSVGYFTVGLYPGSSVRLRVPVLSYERTIVVPTEDTDFLSIE